ncbi:MAG: hypothetical protein D6698_14435 [Gammaproteobacteria bacterium]|nr:MAG: hypothetical protein D6698_14435 [Gammaproteobacteria bacterium]
MPAILLLLLLTGFRTALVFLLRAALRRSCLGKLQVQRLTVMRLAAVLREPMTVTSAILILKTVWSGMASVFQERAGLGMLRMTAQLTMRVVLGGMVLAATITVLILEMRLLILRREYVLITIATLSEQLVWTVLQPARGHVRWELMLQALPAFPATPVIML